MIVTKMTSHSVFHGHWGVTMGIAHDVMMMLKATLIGILWITIIGWYVPASIVLRCAISIAFGPMLGAMFLYGYVSHTIWVSLFLSMILFTWCMMFYNMSL